MHRGLAIEADPGLVASSPEAAFDALVAMAEADGADPEEWLGKALAHAGATRASVVVRGDPRFQVIEDATHRADHVFRVAMKGALREIVALLEGQAEQLPPVPKPGDHKPGAS